MNPSAFEIQKQNLQILAERVGDGGILLPPGFTSQSPIAPDDTTTNQGSIDNLIDNSDFDFSKDGYLNTTPAGGDVAEEVYHFFRHRLIRVTDAVTTNGSTAISSASGPFKAAYAYPMSFLIFGAGGTAGETLTGTLTRVDDNNATLSTNALASIAAAQLWIGDTLAETSAQALKASAHSLFAANEGTNLNIPRWAKTNGWVEVGSDSVENWSIDAPFAQNIIRPSLTLFVICIVKQRAGTAVLPNGVKLFFGIWDGTAAQNRWLEGSNFDLNVQPVGSPGSTSVSYKAIGVLSDGTTIESNIVTITNSAATLSAANYNRLTWANAPGILDFKLYRLMGGAYKRIFTVTNGASDYNDTGGDEETLGGFPEAFSTKAVVYKETTPVTISEDGWVAVGLTLNVPTTYNTQNTTGKQWFRCGTADTTTDKRSVLLDRLGLSLRPGGWNRSSRDRALIAQNNPSSSPTGSDQGDTGIGHCFDELTLIRVQAADGPQMRHITIGKAEKGMWAWDGGRKLRRIRKVRTKIVDRIWLIVLANGAWFKATETERFITSRADRDGTLVSDLFEGDTIVSPDDTGRISMPEIVHMEEQHGEFAVVTLAFYDGHIFAVGNHTDTGIKWAKAHNLKPGPDF